MALITGLGLFVVSVWVAALSRIVAEDIGDWIPPVTRSLIKLAVTWLPEGQRKRFEEEWQSHLNEVPGKVGKLLSAVSFLLAAYRMGVSAARDHQSLIKGWSRSLEQIDEVFSKTNPVVNAITDDEALASDHTVRPHLNRLTSLLGKLKRLRDQLASAIAAASAAPSTPAANLLFMGFNEITGRKFEKIVGTTRQIGEKSNQLLRVLDENKKARQRLLDAIGQTSKGDG